MRNILFAEMQSRKMKQKDFASLIEISPAALSMYFKEEREFAFQTMTQIIRKLFPEKEINVMKKYIKSLRLQDARHALEYCYMNGEFELLEAKLRELARSSNDTDREWAEVYSIVYRRYKGKLTPKEVLSAVRDLYISSIEMSFMKQMLEIYAYYDLDRFEIIMESLDFIERDLADVKNNYIKSSYELRLAQIVAHVLLRFNKLEKCRKYCGLIIEKSNHILMKATIYHTLGHSYIFESYDKALECLIKAMELYVSYGREEHIEGCVNSINFLMNYYDIFPTMLDFDKMNKESLHEIIHYYIKRNNLEKAKEMLLKFDLDTPLSQFSHYSRGFHFYYRGIAFNNTDYFFESIYHFNQQRDEFFAELSRIELRKRGVPESVLKATLGREI